ncbi:MAG: hypothetical protein B6D36_13130 [Planctomycetes bacterium UTPLA1]|nr:MAG: hypothetical protein B6D36_13130 [Planctomycetes bacterium UTPLA1]
MAEPVFKLLRCDAEASHMLGWAKKEVRRLVDFAHLDAFNRTWKFGDVSVRAQYFGGVARLWLEAATAERLAVWATLPNPYPYRGAKFVQRTPEAPTAGGSNWHVSTEVSTDAGVTTYIYTYASAYQTSDAEGQVVQSIAGTATYIESSAPMYSLSMSNFYLPGSTVEQHISFIFTGSGLPPESAPTIREIMSGEMSLLNGPASYSGSLSGYTPSIPDAAYAVAYVSEVVSSDGVSLAAEQTRRYSGGIRYSTPSPTEVPSSVWALRRYDYNGNALPRYSYSHALGFAAPADCVHPVSPADVVAPDPSVLITPEEMSAATLAANNAERDARARRDARFSANADNLIAAAAGGTLATPTAWDFLLKRGAPVSAHTKRMAPLSVMHADTVLSASNPWVVKRTVSAEYLHTYTDENNNIVEEVRSTELIGTKTTRLTQHATPAGDVLSTGISVSEEYVNWYIPAGTLEWDALLDTPGFQPTQHNYHAFITANADYISTHYPLSEQSFGMGLFWTGDVTREGAYHADSTFSPTPGHGFVSSATKVWAAKDMIPPMPAYTNTLRGELPAFFMGYHTGVPVTYDKAFVADENSRVWEPTMGVGWTVTVIPVAPVSSGDSLGMFGVTTEPIVEIEVLGALRFSYSSGTGALVCTGFTPVPSGAVRVAIPSGESLPGNALLIYGGIKWDDVKEKARAQRKALADPNDPAHDPLMKAILDALTPQE